MTTSTRPPVTDMLTPVLPAEVDFISPDPISLRAVDNAWVRKRAAQLTNAVDPGAPNVLGALIEAAQVLYERVGANAKDDGVAILYAPDNETDPYVIGVPLDQRSGYLKRGGGKGASDKPVQEQQPTNHVPVATTHAETTLREDFENALFEEGSFEPSVLNRDSHGKYTTPWVNARWEGFVMYYKHYTIVVSDKYKNKYCKTLGRYVIGKIAGNGAAVFTKAPFRHQTKALAFEEANRLSAEFAAPFGIFRCLDIIDATKG